MCRGREALVLLVLAASLAGCTVLRVGQAWTASRAGFSACTPDPRILCEAGSEALAKLVVPLLPAAIASVERAQYAPFAGPIVVYTHVSRASFARHSGATENAAGAVSLGVLNLSPKLLVNPERARGILTHELSHLHLELVMGTRSLAWARLPAWFHEGLATWVSDGGGAETVSPAEARHALREGRGFAPDDSQWLLFPKTATSYGLAPHLFYREAALFVGYLHEADGAAFEKMITAIAARQPFATAVNGAYGVPLAELWQRFLTTLD